MGFISNQWLNRGQGLRNRKYRPVPVNIVASKPEDSWSLNKKVRVEFTASRADSEYQSVHLTTEEAEAAIGVILAACGSSTRTRIARELLSEVSAHDLIRVLYLRSVKARKKAPK